MMYLGLDTSNYTTSVCAYDGEKIQSIRRIIPVKAGDRGIRQSDGVFCHLKTLPELYKQLSLTEIAAVGVSTRPRSKENSYMPVFLAGKGYGEVIAKTLGIPLYEFSHQDGHIAAGILSGKHTELFEGEFLAVHLSGGTTEILKCAYNGYNFNADIIGGTRDISAGQLIDRAGVYIGLKFPAGAELEKTAAEHTKNLKMPISADDTWLNFSGTENKVIKYLETELREDVAYAVIWTVAMTLTKTINRAIEKYDIERVLIVGGVASNKIIRRELEENIEGSVYFAKPEYSTDNAAGIAYLAYINHKGAY